MTLKSILKLAQGTEDDKLLAKEYLIGDSELLLRFAGMTTVLGSSRSEEDSEETRRIFGSSLLMWEKCRDLLEDSSRNNELLNSLVKELLKETI